MKKSIAILLAALYLSFNAGAILNIHFCGDTVEKISLVNRTDTCCPQPSSCCHDLEFELSINEDYTIVGFIDFKVTQTVAYTVVDEVEVKRNCDQPDSSITLLADAPLLHSKDPIYLSNRALLI